MTQSIYEGRGHLSVERYHGIVHDMQTWKDTFISQQIAVRPPLDKGLNSFPKLAYPFRKSGAISLKAQQMLSLSACYCPLSPWHTGVIVKQTFIKALESASAASFTSLLTPAMVVLLGDAMFTSLCLSYLLLNNLVCVRKIPKINRGRNKTFLGIFL